ncbi:MAG: sigma-70 family RNA polymerase sigma factor [Patescibacteria group bacterium]
MAGIFDKDIIRKIKNGQINNYSYIVKKYTTLIYRFIQRKLFNKEDIDDLVQNVFISFYKAIEKFDEKKPIKPYLFQIVQNELKMYYRSKKQMIPLNDNIYLDHDRDVDIIDINYLTYLKQDEKQIFLYMTEGYSYEEIAKLIKKPVNTIKSIVRRGRLKLKSIYEKT